MAASRTYTQWDKSTLECQKADSTKRKTTQLFLKHTNEDSYRGIPKWPKLEQPEQPNEGALDYNLKYKINTHDSILK